MKYYIPTTSMNFNCILSSESISPVGFYPVRGFGYSRWFAIPENDRDGVVLLYRNPFALTRPMGDQEDHPMLIEIDTDEKFDEVGDGVYASDHTIYLNSLAAKIILFSDDDKRTVLSLADSSLETKMLRFYKKRIVVRSYEGKVPKVSLVKGSSPKQEEIDADRRINKIKGLLYGYYIGALLSSDAKDVEKLNILREIQNIFSSVASSADRRASASQTSRLAELMCSFKREEPLYRELTTLVGAEQIADRIVNLARGYGHELIEHNSDRMLSELAKMKDGMSMPQRWVRDAIEQQNRVMQSRRNKLSVANDEIVTEAGKLLNISSDVLPDADENKLFIAWVNDVLSMSRFTGKISSAKEDLSDELTRKAKEILGPNWTDGNGIKIFMNALRRHVRGEDFVQPWGNGLLSSIAAVVVKGDDWDKLLSFMQGKGMTDYRLAFGFYGVLNGFANLTRDFTDILLNMDAQYLIDVYREFYGELHGITLRIPELEQQETNVSSAAVDTRTSAITQNHVVSEKCAKVIDFFKDPSIKIKVSSRSDVTKSTLLNALSLAISELNDDRALPKLPELLVKKYAVPYGWKKTLSAWKKLQKFVASIAPSEEASMSLPGFEESGDERRTLPIAEFSNRLLAGDWIDECACMIPDLASRRTFINDMRWFVDNHHETYRDKTGIVKGRYFGRYSLSIESIEKHMIEQGRGSKCEGIREDYKKVPVEEIIELLKSRYAK